MPFDIRVTPGDTMAPIARTFDDHVHDTLRHILEEPGWELTCKSQSHWTTNRGGLQITSAVRTLMYSYLVATLQMAPRLKTHFDKILSPQQAQNALSQRQPGVQWRLDALQYHGLRIMSNGHSITTATESKSLP